MLFKLLCKIGLHKKGNYLGRGVVSVDNKGIIPGFWFIYSCQRCPQTIARMAGA